VQLKFQKVSIASAPLSAPFIYSPEILCSSFSGRGVQTAVCEFRASEFLFSVHSHRGDGEIYTEPEKRSSDLEKRAQKK